MTTSDNNGETFTWSKHATDRWQERFSGINKDSELSSAVTIKRKGKTARRIRAATPYNSGKFLSAFTGRHYMKGRSNVIFVIDSVNSVVITVFHLYA